MTLLIIKALDMTEQIIHTHSMKETINAPPPAFAKACPTLRNPTDCGMPSSSILHYLPAFAQIHVG